MSTLYKEGQEMHDLASELWPLPRSLTGEGTRQTLAKFLMLNPDMKVENFRTGDRVFDWTIPKQWDVRNCYLEHESGQRFAEFSKKNLHVLGYSAPLDEILSLKDAQALIYTEPTQPDRIPYVTSYYKERAGFCMAQDEKDTMPEGNYRAFIDSELSDGELQIGELYIAGDSSEEILFSTYVCHPSMANNELSGPVLANSLAQYLQKKKADRGLKYSYRILFLVETIGSIAYLSRHWKKLKKNVLAGFVLSCVGDERAYSHVQSPFADKLSDFALEAALISKPNVKTYSFLERGSDERQFCSPGIDLPVSGYCRSKYGTFPEYHTDADNLEFVTPQGLQGSYDVMKSVIDAFETCLRPRATTKCEPQLGQRGLYPTISQKGSYDSVKLRTNILAYARNQTVFELCKEINAPLYDVIQELEVLVQNDLIAQSE